MGTWSLDLIETADGESVKHLIVNGPWTEDYSAVWQQERPPSLGWNPQGAPIDVLPSLAGLERLRVSGTCDDASPVLACSSLLELGLWVTDERPLDLSAFVRLQMLETNGPTDPDTLASATCLREFRMQNWPDQTLGRALAAPSLERLQLDGARRLRTLEGTSTTLRKLLIAYGRGPVSCKGIGGLENLRDLTLQRITLADSDSLGDVAEMRTASFIGCRGMQSVEWTRRTRHLAAFAWEGGEIESLDLAPLDEVDARESVWVQPKRGYNRTFNPEPISVEEGERLARERL